MRNKLALAILITLFSAAATAQEATGAGASTTGTGTSAAGGTTMTTGGVSFSTMDTNGDGSVDDGEWDEYFDTLDTNDDDKLDQSEFSASGMGGAGATTEGGATGTEGTTEPETPAGG